MLFFLTYNLLSFVSLRLALGRRKDCTNVFQLRYVSHLKWCQRNLYGYRLSVHHHGRDARRQTNNFRCVTMTMAAVGRRSEGGGFVSFSSMAKTFLTSEGASVSILSRLFLRLRFMTNAFFLACRYDNEALRHRLPCSPFVRCGLRTSDTGSSDIGLEC